MKFASKLARWSGLIGAGVGITLFAVYGVWQGAAMGGTLGLAIMNSIALASAGGSLFGRIVVAASMATGVIVSAVMFVVLCAFVLWVAGYIIGLLSEPHAGLGKSAHAK